MPALDYLNDLKAEFSLAYSRAVSSAAGFFLEERGRSADALGIDATIMARHRDPNWKRKPTLDLQLKCTADQVALGADIEINLKRKNYDELRDTNLANPRILVVVIVPQNHGDWINHSPSELTMYRCGYWRSLRGEPDISHKSKTIDVSQTSVFDISALKSIMDRIGTGLLP